MVATEDRWNEAKAMSSGVIRWPTWSPDGTQVAWVTNPGSNPKVWVGSPETPAVQLNVPGVPGIPAWGSR
jgi:Tol biopolymer transport system component